MSESVVKISQNLSLSGAVSNRMRIFITVVALYSVQLSVKEKFMAEYLIFQGRKLKMRLQTLLFSAGLRGDMIL